MAKGAEAGPKTGKFHLCVEAGLEASEAEKDHKRLRLLNKMMHRMAVSLLDGRRYELVAWVGLWEPGDWPDSERLQVDFTLVLLDLLTAEVGEWVKDLPHWVPDGHTTAILGEGHGEASGWMFQRGRLGWQRVE